MISLSVEPPEIEAGRDSAVEVVLRNVGDARCRRVRLLRDVPEVICNGRHEFTVPLLLPGEEHREEWHILAASPGEVVLPIRTLDWVDERGFSVRAEPPELTVISRPPRDERPAARRRRPRPTTFVSYRREDSSAATWAMIAALRAADLAVFADTVLRPADVWPSVLRHELAEASVLLAVIGPGWLHACTPTGRRRLDEPDDWVRLEIEMALRRHLPVVPVLLEGAEVPPRRELPDSLSALCVHQAVRWTPGSSALIDHVRRLTR